MSPRITAKDEVLSQSIHSLSVPASSGVIGILDSRNMQSDIFAEPSAAFLKNYVQTVASWQAKALVTLADPMQLHVLESNRLSDKLAEMEILWFHLPCKRYSLAYNTLGPLWEITSEHIRAILEVGGKILIHCNEGIGRSGMIAGRLLTDIGIEREEARSLVNKTLKPALEAWEHDAFFKLM